MAGVRETPATLVTHKSWSRHELSPTSSHVCELSTQGEPERQEGHSKGEFQSDGI